jgi:hypothetical protein
MVDAKENAMRRTPGKDSTKPEKPARDPAFDLVKAKPEPEAAEGELEARIERLEKRLDESVRGNDGLALAADNGVDRSETEDALKRAVSRSHDKRDQKA